MKRFLFLIVEGGGNVPAQMSIARRLVARGHEVHVLADRHFVQVRSGWLLSSHET